MLFPQIKEVHSSSLYSDPIVCCLLNIPLNAPNLVSKIQLKVNDAALRIEVNVNALDLPSSPDVRVHASLQEHITKLQVKRLHMGDFDFWV